MDIKSQIQENDHDQHLEERRKHKPSALAPFLGILRTIVNIALGRAQGPDVSRYSVFFKPGIAKETIHFAIQKLTEGTGYVDLAVETIWEGIKQIPLRGGYHYQRSGMSWSAQVTNLLNTAARFDHHFLVVDLEGINNTYSDTFFADTRRIIDACSAQKKTILYTNISTYELFAAAIKRLYMDGQQWLDNLELWIAYPSEIRTSPPLPKGRETAKRPWLFWQFSWTGTPEDWGTGSYTDVNISSLTPDQLYALFGIDPEPTPPPPPPDPVGEDVYYKVVPEVTTANLNVRADGSPTATDLGAFNLKAGDIIHSVEKRISGAYTYHRFDVLWRDGVRYDFPFTGFPTYVQSPSNQYWTASKGGTSTWMKETTKPVDPAPLPPPLNAKLTILVTNPETGKKYGGTNIELPEIIE